MYHIEPGTESAWRIRLQPDVVSGGHFVTLLAPGASQGHTFLKRPFDEELHIREAGFALDITRSSDVHVDESEVERMLAVQPNGKTKIEELLEEAMRIEEASGMRYRGGGSFR